MTTKTTIKNGDITLPITHTGEGRKLIFFNGAGATQFAWRKVVALLKDRYETVTFDFRGHGDASAASDYSLAAFLSDAEAVMSNETIENKPVVVAWSLGADVALAYAAKNPGKLAGMVIVDGAMPISVPLVEDEKKTRRTMDSIVMKFSLFLIRLSPTLRYQMPGSAMADIVVALDPVRLKYIDMYEHLDIPITAVVAKKYDGQNTPHSVRNRKIWAEAAERLHQVRPDIAIQWIDDTHASLPLKHPEELAKLVDEFASKVG